MVVDAEQTTLRAIISNIKPEKFAKEWDGDEVVENSRRFEY